METETEAPSTQHEGLRAAYNARRVFYYCDVYTAEKRIKLVKKNCKFKRLNALLDLGVKV